MLVNIIGTTKQKAAAIFDAAKTADIASKDSLIDKLETASVKDIDTWVDKNIRDLAAARALFKKMLVVMSYLLNKE